MGQVMSVDMGAGVEVMGALKNWCHFEDDFFSLFV